MVDIVLANMTDPIDRPPQAHFFFDDRVAWVNVDDGLPRLGGPDWADAGKPDQRRRALSASMPSRL